MMQTKDEGLLGSQYECLYCGDDFRYPYGKRGAPKYCSARCKRRAEVSRRRRRARSAPRTYSSDAVRDSREVSQAYGIPEASFSAPFFKKGALT